MTAHLAMIFAAAGLLTACGGSPESGDSAGSEEEAATDSSVHWEVLSEADLGGGEDDKEDGDYPPCDDEVVDGEACEGDWTTTTCIDEAGAYWWCQDGAWTSEK